MLKTATARCWSLDTYNPVPGLMPGVPSSRNYENGFACELMLKDIGIAKEAAKKVGANIPIGLHTVDVYKQLCDKGMGKKDFGVVY